MVVPNQVLAANQQDKHRPWACRVSDDLFNRNTKEVFYHTYEDFLTGEIPLDKLFGGWDWCTFLQHKPKGTKLFSAILLLKSTKPLEWQQLSEEVKVKARF